jgi:hypothetical protein
MAVKADEVQHPDQIEDTFDWESIAETGEPADPGTRRTLNLAHRAIAKFPELRGKYKAYAGAAAVVSSAAALTGAIAITRKMRRGMAADKALAALTAADIENAVHVAARDQRYKRLLRKIVRRRGNGARAGQSR